MALVALLRAIPALENLKVENPDQKTAVDIVRKEIQAPARQIVDNAGADGAVVIGKLVDAKEYNYCHNAQVGGATAAITGTTPSVCRLNPSCSLLRVSQMAITNR